MDNVGSGGPGRRGGAGPRRSFRRACSAFFRRLASRLQQPTPPPWDVDIDKPPPSQSPSPGPTPRPSPVSHQPPTLHPRGAPRRRLDSPTPHPRIHPRSEDNNNGDNDYITDPTQGEVMGPRAPPEGSLVNTGREHRAPKARTRDVAAPRGPEQHSVMGTADSVDTVGEEQSEEGVRQQQQQPPPLEVEADYVVVLPAKATDFNSNVTEMMRRRESPARQATGEHVAWIERGHHREMCVERRDGGDDNGRRELHGEVTCSEQSLDLGALRRRRS
uniref:Serine/arginine repetitive matrix protein 1-like n=1 Tax=Petromyzon marinus TaxID=7757 RepID=A0AAJ7U9W7_PETMA|nr:serine/arginine repetitive matrix protein 1-like [Petromyzon marinus]